MTLRFNEIWSVLWEQPAVNWSRIPTTTDLRLSELLWEDVNMVSPCGTMVDGFWKYPNYYLTRAKWLLSSLVKAEVFPRSKDCWGIIEPSQVNRASQKVMRGPKKENAVPLSLKLKVLGSRCNGAETNDDRFPHGHSIIPNVRKG